MDIRGYILTIPKPEHNPHYSEADTTNSAKETAQGVMNDFWFRLAVGLAAVALFAVPVLHHLWISYELQAVAQWDSGPLVRRMQYERTAFVLRYTEWYFVGLVALAWVSAGVVWAKRRRAF